MHTHTHTQTHSHTQARTHEQGYYYHYHTYSKVFSKKICSSNSKRGKVTAGLLNPSFEIRRQGK
jgi:hypothetical protein